MNARETLHHAALILFPTAEGRFEVQKSKLAGIAPGAILTTDEAAAAFAALPAAETARADLEDLASTVVSPQLRSRPSSLATPSASS